MIIGERLRQIGEEGYNAEHDDRHKNKELSAAAAAYLLADRSRFPKNWDMRLFKPSSYMRNLVIAGALIAAEIDRLYRIIEREYKK